MRTGKFVVLILTGLLLAMPALAQVISQTPRPDVQSPKADTVETIGQHDEGVGRLRSSVQVPRSGALLFAGFDSNGDYIIDKSEVAAGIERAFAQADHNSNEILSLVEIEGWRVAALGFEDATPSNYTFAPNFARTVSREKFTEVLMKLADKLDTDDQSEMDGKIALSDLLKNYRPRRQHNSEKNKSCIDAVRDERRRAQQQCRNSRR